MSTPVTNFAKVTVSTGYGSADTSIVLTTGHGSRLPSTFPYPLTWWDATTYSDPNDDPNREIVIVTTRTGDTLTVTRGGEGTSASTKNTGGKTYKMLEGITAAMWAALGDLSLSETFRGLYLRTHPDSDKSLSQVRLVHADAIVMSDGEEVANWDDVDFNISAANGIGGLDTGSEAASTWYEVYAMWNGTTKGLMGHRAKNYLLDVSYTTGEDASQGLRSNVDNSTVKVSQAFTTVTAGPLEFLDVKLIKTGTPTGNYWFTIEAVSGGVPSGTPLATSDKMDASRILTTSEWVRIVFRTPLSVSAATQYYLVLQGDYAVSGSNFISWRMDGSAGTYASNSKALFDSDTSTWTVDTDDDMMFKVYITVNDTPLTIPAGYRTALIGYVYNDSGNNFVLFRQKDRRWNYHVLALLVNETVGSATLIDLFTVLPPRTVYAQLALTGTGAASAAAAIGDIKMTDVVNAGGGPFTVTLGYFGTSEFPGTPGGLALEYNGLMMDATSGADLYIHGFEW